MQSRHVVNILHTSFDNNILSSKVHTMITNPIALENFERELQRAESLTLDQKLLILDGMYDLALSFGHFQTDQHSLPLQHQIRTAKILRQSCLELL